MPNLNKVMLMGNLTRDVELKYTQSNQAVANLGLAVNRRWKTPEGEDREEVTFVDCEAWGRTAETLQKYLSKGRPVFIEGRLKLDQWEKEGQKHSKMKVVVEGFQFIDSKQGSGGGSGGGGGGGGGGGDEYTPPSRSARPTAARGASSPSPTPPPQMGEDDIPF